jgi:phosphopantothenoylcysteine decarboxylase/phosphopantothenate--cysteine ligase
MSRELIIGVSGGIAAYKSAALVSSLVQEGHGVTVVMTRAARKFVGPATFRALTGRPVATDQFDVITRSARHRTGRQGRTAVRRSASADLLQKPLAA